MSDIGNKQVMAENIQFYMNKNGIDRMQLSKAIDVAYTTVTDWVKARTYPRIDKIEMMANYFNIEKSDLVEKRGSLIPARTVNDGKIQIYVSSREEMLVIAYRELGEDDKSLVLQLTRSLAKKRN